MKLSNKNLFLVYVASCVGCAPLQQAPLLYSSKSTVGVDISTSTTETPGTSINLGVKIVDAAYVPVAVSKDTSNKNGETKAFEILKIEAVYGEGNSGVSEDSLTEENKTKIKAYLDAKRIEDLSKTNFDDVNNKINSLNQELEKLKADLSKEKESREKATAKTPPEDTELIDSNINDINVEIQEKETEKNTQSTILAMKNTEWQNKKNEADKLFLSAAQAASLLRTDKHDALSVYGRFDSRGEGKVDTTPSSSLTVGKIFSTGVASQNLTEAVKNSVTAQCLETVKMLVEKIDDANKAKRDELIGKIDTICKKN